MEQVPEQHLDVEQELREEKHSFLSNIPLLYIIGGLCLLIILGVSIFLIQYKKANAAMISGTINYTALKPDPGDRGQVTIQERKYGSKDQFKTIYQSALQDNAPWTFNTAVGGQPYEMIALLNVDGKLVTTSEPLIVTGPAKNQQLNLHVTWHDLPTTVVQEQTTYIKGTAVINGYIPQGSVLTIQANAQPVATITNPQSTNNWEWTKTTPLKDYLLQAVLRQGTTQIGQSEIITAAGGDSELALTINSTAQPSSTPTNSQTSKTNTPTPQMTNTSISGTIYVNGPENNNTSVLLLWRYPGEKDYKVITRIQNPSHNGQSWVWTSVQVGRQYDITAVLQVNNHNTASAQGQIVTAPAKNINFTLNTGVFIPTPNANVTVNACNSIGNNQYNATISYPQQSNAGNYWFQVGNGTGGSNIYNTKIAANNANPQVTFQIYSNTTYYAQYAYSLCTNCTEDQNFSNFSNSSPFSCGGSPVYTGYYCNSANNTCQATTNPNPPYAYNNTGLTLCQQQCQPTPTPTPTTVPPTATPTPRIAYCNQSCASNGFVCNGSLTCFDQGVPGSGVCRNPSCTDQTDCTCPPQ
jgi:hypothetical protein